MVPDKLQAVLQGQLVLLALRQGDELGVLGVDDHVPTLLTGEGNSVPGPQRGRIFVVAQHEIAAARGIDRDQCLLQQCATYRPRAQRQRECQTEECGSAEPS